jgi:hypothetical protein
VSDELRPTRASEELEGNEWCDVTAGRENGTPSVKGSDITLRQAGVQSVEADNLVIRQGGVVRAQADHLEMLQGGVLLAQTETANLTASRAGVLLSGGQVRLEQTGVSAHNCRTVLLLTKQVDGTVHTAFGPRDSVIFGVAVGAAAGLILSLFRLLRRR